MTSKAKELRDYIIGMDVGHYVMAGNAMGKVGIKDDADRRLAMSVIWGLVDGGHLRHIAYSGGESPISAGSIADYASRLEKAIYDENGYEVMNGCIWFEFQRIPTIDEYKAAAGKSLSAEDSSTLKRVLEQKETLVALAHKIEREVTRISRGE